MSAPKWFHTSREACPHSEKMAGPCQGHRAAKELRAAADVVAWLDGWAGITDPEMDDGHVCDVFLTARRCLADLQADRS